MVKLQLASWTIPSYMELLGDVPPGGKHPFPITSGVFIWE